MIVTTFLQTTLRNIEKTQFIGTTQFLVSLCDIGLNRHCRSAKLRNQPKLFFIRKMLSHTIHFQDEVMGLLPNQ